MTTTINDIPKEDFKKMRERVIEQLSSMNEDELQIAMKTKDSLAKTIGLLFQEVAKLMGYAITYPLFLAVKVANSFIKGLADGTTRAWNDVFDE